MPARSASLRRTVKALVVLLLATLGVAALHAFGVGGFVLSRPVPGDQIPDLVSAAIERPRRFERADS